MPHFAIHEILYRDDLGQPARIDPGAELSKDQEKAIGKESLDSMVKSKALKKVTIAEAEKVRDAGDGFGAANVVK